jgi:hypothetical protein
MSRTGKIRHTAGLVAVVVAVGGIASPAQAAPSTACVHIFKKQDVYEQKANAAAQVTAPSMIWAATGTAGRHEAVWYYYWENMQAAGDWADLATLIGCDSWTGVR